jgi:HlyD family secretion protein
MTNMDIELSDIDKKKQRIRKLIPILIISFIIIILFTGFYFLIQPSVKLSELRLFIVETGDIEASVTGSGVVTPQFEQLISSPIEAKLEKVLFNTGDQIAKGQSILVLNKEFSLLNFEKQKDELSLKRNKILQHDLALEKSINELQTQSEIQQLKVESLKSIFDDEKQLKKIGGTTDDKLKQADLNLKIAKEEYNLLQKKIQNLKESKKADLTGLNLEIKIQEKSLKELEKKLEMADIKAESDGVITWVKSELGTNVSPGETLVRVADLGNYKVEGSISDLHSSKLTTGAQVKVRFNKNDLKGIISSIKPSVENGVVNFTVSLEENNHPSLRPNIRTEVFVITSYKNNILRVKNGPFFRGKKEQKVFVIQGDKLVARQVKIGESNIDFIEIIDGLNPGDKLIISDMEEYSHLSEIKLK